jgi:starvation-inducible DNA-binding protein
MNATSKISQLKTGINNESVLADILTGCLADTYVLMIKTQGFHWNVAGPLFKSFHDLTEAHYENLFAAGDILAERVRALGYPAPYSIAEMLEASQIPEEDGTPNAAGMLKALISGHESTAKRFRNAVSEADDHHDVATVDLLTGRIAFHEKAVWMLKSMAA